MMILRPFFCSMGLIVLAVPVCAQTIPDQIDAILARAAVAGNSWTASIENHDGSVIYYQRNPVVGLAPASNTKLFTTAAAFGLLGTNYSFVSRVYRDGVLNSGVLSGNLNLVSEHDITWNTSVFPGNASAALNRIATQLKSLGLTAINGDVQCYGLCAFGFGSTDNLAANTTLAKNADAAVAFVAALQAQGITVSGNAVGQSGFAPAGTLYYTHNSSDLTYGGKPLRLGVASIPLLKVSHNVMADGLCRHLGWKLGTGDSYAAGATQVLRWLNNIAAISTNGMVMNDGSGLSHGNRFSARQCLAVVRYMLAAFPTWDDGLPIGCVDGTIGSRFCGTDGSGQVHAKTGSLSISIALSGYIDNKYDNRRYLFSFVGNETSIDQAATRDAIDDAVVLMGARGVPLSPELRLVSSRPNGTSLRVAWLDQKFVRTGYRLYGSTDGINFGPPIDLGSNVQSYIDPGLVAGAKKYYKVSVVDGPFESKPSRVYGAQAGGAARVLIVDGNDRWQFQTTENPNCTNHSFAAFTGQNISGVVFETAHHNAVIDASVSLTNYSTVIWLLGEESTADETFSATEQGLVADYLAAGGNLFVSGAEIGWDLDRDSGPTIADRNFYRNQLRASLNGNANDDANTQNFSPAGASIFAGSPSGAFDNGTSGTYNIEFPDVLTPTNGSSKALLYPGVGNRGAAIQYDGSLGGGRIVNFGFPFETITNSAVRDAYMSDVLRFFGVLEPPLLMPPRIDYTNQQVILSWSASAGLTYQVQFKTSLSETSWQSLGATITATNTAACKSDLKSEIQRFYRVVLLN